MGRQAILVGQAVDGWPGSTVGPGRSGRYVGGNTRGPLPQNALLG